MTQAIPLTYYTRGGWIPLAPLATTTIVPHTVRTMEIPPYIASMNNFEMFHRDHPSKAMSELYKFFQHRQPYTAMHGDGKKKDSWWEFFNPFACDTEYEDDGDVDDFINDDDDDDEDEDDDGFDLFKRRKMQKHMKKKKQKQKIKKKKKKILLKFVVGFLAFLAIKFLFEKLWSLFPTIFPTTARDELLNEVDLLLDEGLELDRGHSWRQTELFEMQNRALFAPSYEETRIDLTIPMKRRIFAQF